VQEACFLGAAITPKPFSWGGTFADRRVQLRTWPWPFFGEPSAATGPRVQVCDWPIGGNGITTCYDWGGVVAGQYRGAPSPRWHHLFGFSRHRLMSGYYKKRTTSQGSPRKTGRFVLLVRRHTIAGWFGSAVLAISGCQVVETLHRAIHQGTHVHRGENHRCAASAALAAGAFLTSHASNRYPHRDRNSRAPAASCCA